MGLIVTESVHGTWFYHLSEENNPSKSLCNKDTMKTNTSLSQWGYVGHLNERYCEECVNIRNSLRMNAKDLFPTEQERKYIKSICDMWKGKVTMVVENDEVIYENIDSLRNYCLRTPSTLIKIRY